MRIEIFPDKGRKYRARLRFDNDEIFMTSESYSRKRECEASVASMLWDLRSSINNKVTCLNIDGNVSSSSDIIDFVETILSRRR